MDYSELAKVYQELESTSQRLSKTYIISEFLKKIASDDLKEIVLLLIGRVLPIWDEQKIGMSSRLILKAISTSFGIKSSEIETRWTKTGDLGLVAQEIAKKKKQQTLFAENISTKKVFSNLSKLATLEGAGTVDNKVKLVANLLTSAEPIEAKYIVRTVLEDLRIGAGIGTIRDAIAWAYLPTVAGINTRCSNCNEIYHSTFNKCPKCQTKKEGKKHDEYIESFKDIKVLEEFNKKDILDIADEKIVAGKTESVSRDIYNAVTECVQTAYDKTNDISKVAAVAEEKGIKGLMGFKIEMFKPINVMLFPKASDLEDAFNTVGKPAAIEYKYDGFRLQIHKKENNIMLYTRRLENVTTQFPDVVRYAKESIDAKEAIIDCEVIGIDQKTGKSLAFQNISMRIKRKYDIEKLAEKVPVVVDVFDIIMLEGKELLDTAFEKRRALIKKIIKTTNKFMPAEQLVTENIEEANEFYAKSLNKGNEGIMMKSLDGVYKPGARVGYGVKVKPVMDSLDLVITGAEWGEGKRAGWLTSFLVSCIDEDGNLMTIGKVSTGVKEIGKGVTYNHMTELLKPLIKKENGKVVEVIPKIVIEIHFEEIQKSETYESGYALRFPRFINIREDKPVSECSTIEMIDELYHEQRFRKS